jgi:CHAT domain-containing protein
MGAKNVVASHWAVGDKATTDWMRSFYTSIGNGQPLIKATQLAALEMRDVYPSAAQWAAFSLYGAGKCFGTYEKNQSHTRRT